MIFELISWIYISLICLIWGNLILKLFFGINEVAVIDFPIVCFIGMSVIGIVAIYISLVIPLVIAVKLILQIPAFLFLLNPSRRKKFFSQLKKPFIGLSIMDFVFLTSAILMILFLCTTLIIHPDTINYHAFSTNIFDKYGTVPGIANLKPQYGFQSNWFAGLAFFDFSIFQFGPWFPLNGCVMCWVIVFLVSKAAVLKNGFSHSQHFPSGIWYLLFILFAILSWTQIRLTASSLSPDFIAAIAILLAFYFFTGRRGQITEEKADLLASFFSVAAISIKFSALPVLLIPLLIICKGLWKGRWLYAGRILFIVVLLITPIVIRNIISTGYPFYPSSFAAIYSSDWKVDESQVLKIQHYITSYARYPILMVNVVKEYNNPIIDWLPLWWRHLYMIDKAVMLLIILGGVLDILFLKLWIAFYNRKTLATFFIAVIGFLLWFIKAPDPRFGTGFLLPLIYFQYIPVISYIRRIEDKYLFVIVQGIKSISTALIFLYVGYRAVNFFHPCQLIYPEGIKKESAIRADCDEQIRKMVMDDAVSPGQLPDSCMHFSFRGTAIKQGFTPAQ